LFSSDGKSVTHSIDNLKNEHPLLSFALTIRHIQTIIEANDKMFEDYSHEGKEAIHSGSKSRPGGGEKDCSELFAIKV
jgi:hypothetical protein